MMIQENISAPCTLLDFPVLERFVEEMGTRDLGQETLIALSKVDPGRGLTAGICVAFIAIAADRLINAWAARRKKELGLEALAAP